MTPKVRMGQKSDPEDTAIGSIEAFQTKKSKKAYNSAVCPVQQEEKLPRRASGTGC